MTEDEERRSSLERARQGAAGAPRSEPPIVEGAPQALGAEPEVVAAEAALSAQDPFDAKAFDVTGGDAKPPVSEPEPPTAIRDPGAPESRDAAWSAEPPAAFEAAPAESAPFRAVDEPGSDGRRAAVEPQAARNGSSMVPALLGVVILVLLAALAYLLFAQPGESRVAQTETGLDALNKRVAAIESKAVPAADLAALKQRLDATDGQVATLKTDLTALQGKVATPAPTADPAAPAAASDDKLAEADSKIAEAGSMIAASEGKIADLGHAVDDIRTALANLPKPDFGPVTTRLDGVDTQVAALQTKVDGVPAAVMASVTPKLDALDGRLKPLEAEQQAAKAPERITDIRQNGSAAETRAAPLAVTAQAVVRAIESGQPFASDVKALETLGADPKLVQPLQAVAAEGAPGLQELRTDLAGLRDRMLAGSTPAPSGSYLDRLMAGAGALVHVRPLGSVVGDTPPAILARMDADLAGDDLGAALAEWQKLPEEARQVSKGLADRIRLRLAAETAAKSIASDAIRAMASNAP